LNALLQSLGLDVQYDRARGDFIYYESDVDYKSDVGCQDESASAVEVLDLVGGFGSLLLGHNHPQLTAAAIEFLQSGAASHLQGSANRLATRLARELSRRLGGDYCAVFANSGAEGVEAALKHALLQTGGHTFLALEGAFHGKTLGALQLTSNPFFREPFAGQGPQVVWVRPNDLEDLQRAFAQADRLAGFVFEPIQGEGGVRPVEPAFLQRAAELCREYRIPLIADECQTGLGRTGTFLASHALGVEPDYVVLSKALGGGLAKISALLVDRARYAPQFDLLHSSTFGADAFSLTLALRTLELLDEQLLDDCRRKGAMLKCLLRRLQDKYPGVVADVRGAGLMLGVELRQPTDRDSLVLRFLANSNLMGLCVAGNLLRQHRIRVAPTLSDPWTLRVQPSALVSEDSLTRFAGALDQVLAQIARGDVAGFTRCLLAGGSDPTTASVSWPAQSDRLEFQPSERAKSPRCVSVRRVAWLFHLIDADCLPHLEPGLRELPQRDRETFLNRVAPLVQPVVLEPTLIRSATGELVELFPILLPVTSRWLKSQYQRRQYRKLRALVQQGVDVAATLRCAVLSLGQFTSIVTGQGRHLVSRGLGITSGNSLPAALAIDAVLTTLARRGEHPGDRSIAIVGAAGDIGQVCAEMLVPRFRSATLVGSGRPGSLLRLQRVAQLGGAVATSDLAAVRAADVVVCATNSVQATLTAQHLARHAVVCDLSVPPTLDHTIASQRPEVTFLPGGVLRLPGGEDLGIPGLRLPTGTAYGCLAEGVLLAWRGLGDGAFVGRTCPRNVREIAALASRHGFHSAVLDRPESALSSFAGSPDDLARFPSLAVE
jgi:acetylornithine/succinyldiaminopimelate/putrescine aminotransferase/predicted amino acid dehydrogenase